MTEPKVTKRELIEALAGALVKYGLCKCPLGDMRGRHLEGCEYAAALALVTGGSHD